MKRRQRELVEAWSLVPIGTEVVVHEDEGHEFKTKTRSGPWMLGQDGDGKGGHTAVIQVEGIPGCYSLERISKVQP